MYIPTSKRTDYFVTRFSTSIDHTFIYRNNVHITASWEVKKLFHRCQSVSSWHGNQVEINLIRPHLASGMLHHHSSLCHRVVVTDWVDMYHWPQWAVYYQMPCHSRHIPSAWSPSLPVEALPPLSCCRQQTPCLPHTGRHLLSIRP